MGRLHLPSSLFESKPNHCLLDQTLSGIVSRLLQHPVHRSRRDYCRYQYCHIVQIVWLWGLVSNKVWEGMSVSIMIGECILVTIMVWEGVLSPAEVSKTSFNAKLYSNAFLAWERSIRHMQVLTWVTKSPGLALPVMRAVQAQWWERGRKGGC